MKTATLGRICKQFGECTLAYDGGERYCGPRAAMYKLSANFPDINQMEEFAEIFSYTRKERDSVHFAVMPLPSSAEVYCGEEEKACRVPEIGITIDGKEMLVLICEDGAAGLIDRRLLTPIADVIKDNGYITWVRRTWGNGGIYYALKDGMEIVGLFMPIEPMGDTTINELQDIVTACAITKQRSGTGKEQYRPPKTDESALDAK